MLTKKTSHATVDNRIAELDNMLMRANGNATTRFTSISDVLGGKVKTFGVREHVSDEHFRAIFSSGNPGGRRVLSVHPEVTLRYHPLNTSISALGGGADVVDHEESDDQNDSEDEAMEPLHSSKGKKRAVPDSEDQSKKTKLLHPSADDGSVKQEILFHQVKAEGLELELTRFKEEALAELTKVKKDAEQLLQESETKLGIFKEEALASEQRLRQESEAKVKRVEEDAEAELVRVKGEAVAAFEATIEASEAELTKVKSEAEVYKTTAEQLLQKSKEDCKKLTNEHDTYRAHIENPYIEGSTAYYKMQYDTLKSDMQNPDKYGSAAYHKNETDMCNIDCADLRMKLEKLPKLLEDLERLKEKVKQT